MGIQWSGIKNEKVLNDGAIEEESKKKIQDIEKYKQFFYEYFDKKPTSIYSKTTFLESEAVTYLVIASPKTEIKPLMHSFPFVGEFPYLGFFNKGKAIAYAKKLEREKDYSVFVRPVYAYSTLGFFEDRILSSFFYFDELDLSELIFHELFHTIFFIKNDVDFNEAVAEHFAKKLVPLYFAQGEEELEKNKKRREIDKSYAKLVSDFVQRLQIEYKKKEGIDGHEAGQILQTLLENDLRPKLRKFCEKYSWSDCPSEVEWNNARFAAFLTYEDKQDEISHIQEAHNFTLKEFLSYLENAEKEFKKQKEYKSFLEFLKREK